MNKKKILIVTSEFPPQPGGIGNHAYYLALSLIKNNYLVYVIADQRSLLGKEEANFDSKLPFTVVRVKRYSFRLRMYFNRIITTYKYFSKVSHVIATGKFSLWNVAFISNFKKAQTLAVIHGSEVNFKSYLLKKSVDKSLKKFHSIVAVSNYTKNLIQHINRKVEVIPNGIHLEDWKTKDILKSTLSGNPLLTTVGRVSSRKGQLQVIKQLPELLKKYPEIQYHCVGIPTEADNFLKKAKELGVESHVFFHGILSEAALKATLLATDVFVMMSTESETGDVEGFGIAILEANALGVPAIGSRGCGIEDAIKPNISGFLIESSNTKEFLNCIEKILQNKDAYKVGANNWAKQHDWSTIIKRYITLLK